MGLDLFGSFNKSSCANLVVSSMSSFGTEFDFYAMNFLLLISAMGILICLITALFTTSFLVIKSVKEIELTLKKKLIISTLLMTHMFFSVGSGLWAGLIIGYVTEFYTSNAYK
ncbi:hypothetical protein SELMODRAFT_233486 [Selaginella moellendorffii]|uniref:H(+)-exporting diphosphatase n=1 Tax=Selaginella moellendorffii TaxID=88036 RepID=D8S9S7_SELML|nr:hypothetical protein SELMODRAFT_233486 [Selaginella moellendorffii]